MNNAPKPVPGPEEYAKCSTLVAKVVIQNNHCFTQDEIDLADYVLDFQWNPNVNGFLHVIAGIAHARLEVEEAYVALVYPLKRLRATFLALRASPWDVVVRESSFQLLSQLN